MLDSIKLDLEEQEIVDAFERDELTPIANMERELKLHQAYAAETLKKDKRIAMRIYGRDLDGLRQQQYVTGRLAEVAPAG